MENKIYNIKKMLREAKETSEVENLKKKNTKKLQNFLKFHKDEIDETIDKRFEFIDFSFLKNLKIKTEKDEYYGFFVKKLYNGNKQFFCLVKHEKFPKIFEAEGFFDNYDYGVRDFIFQIVTKNCLDCKILYININININEFDFDKNGMENKIYNIKKRLKTKYVEYFDLLIEDQKPVLQQLKTLDILYWVGQFHDPHFKFQMEACEYNHEFSS